MPLNGSAVSSSMPHTTFTATLVRGIVAGAAGGLAAAVIQLAFVEQPLRAALAIEEARAAGPGAEHHEELFDRTTQVVGGLLATLVVGVALGAVFATVYARLRHRLAGRRDFDRAMGLAGVTFVACSLLPGVKYPANPPGVGEPGTVEERTLAYLSLIAASLLVVALLPQLAAWLARRGWERPARLTATAAAGAVVIGAILALWPANPDTVPADVPATVLWEFRLLSLLELAALWAVIGAAFGLLLEHLQRQTATRR